MKLVLETTSVWQPTPVLLPGKSQGQGAWWAAVSGSHRVGHH